MAELTEAPKRLGKYDLIGLIGQGGMADVYLARLRGPGHFRKLLVVKTIKPELASEEHFIKMLFDEASVAALIKHPRVVDIYDLGEDGGTYYMVMEYLDGEPLTALLEAGAAGHPLDVLSAVRIITDVAEGLHAAHEWRTLSGKPLEIVHRDVTPANVLVLFDGNVKIVDFGIAKARGRLTQSGARQLKGKLGYMSPEQLAAEMVDRRSDVFSLGIVFWELLTSKRLFSAPSDSALYNQMMSGTVPPPSSFRQNVPPIIDELCLRALAPRPSDRFQTADQMHKTLYATLRTLGARRQNQTIAKYMFRMFASRRNARMGMYRERVTTPSVVSVVVPRPDGEIDISFDSAPKATLDETFSRTRPLPWRWAAVGTVSAALALGLYFGRGLLRPTQVTDHRLATPSGATTAPPTSRKVTSAPAEEPKPPEVPTARAATDPDDVEPAGDEPGQTGPSAEGPASPAPAPAPAARPERPTSYRRTGSPTRLYEEGTALFVKGELVQAKARFREAIAIDPSHAPSHRGLGLVYQSQGDVKHAVAELERYLRLAPGADDAPAIEARIARLKESR